MIVCRHILNPFEPASGTVETLEDWSGITAADVAARCTEPVEIAVNDRYIEPAERAVLVLKDGDQVVIVPSMGMGRNVMGLVALAALAFATPALATLARGVLWAGGMASSVPYGMLSMGIFVGGAMLVSNMLTVKPAKPDKPAYGFSQTTQQVGGIVPVVYGRTKVTGNVIACWTSHTNTTAAVPDIYKAFMTGKYVLGAMFGKRPTVDPADIAGATYPVKTTEKLYCLLDCGTGPVGGIVAATVKINGRPYTDYSGITVTTRAGTLAQTAITNFGTTKLEKRPMIEVTNSGGAVTWTTPDAVATRLEIGLYFERGIHKIDTNDGEKTFNVVGYKIEISEAGAGSWSTLVEDKTGSDTTQPLWLTFDTDVDYTGGDPVTITRGTRYDIKVTKTTSDHTGANYGDTLRLGVVRELIEIGFTYPGRVLVGIEALATKELNGSLQFEAEMEGQIVADTTSGALAYSNDPGSIVQHLVTGPVISGDGDGTPFAVEQYDGVDVAQITAADFQALTDYANDSVDDGLGGTENRVTLNGAITAVSNRWEAAAYAAGLARAALVRRGKNVGLFIDKAATAVFCFSDVNILMDTYRDWPIPSDQRASEVNCHFQDSAANYDPVTLMVINSNIDTAADADLDCGLLTKKSEVSRHGKYTLAKNQYIRRGYSWQSYCDAVAVEVGDVCYLRRYPTGRCITSTNNTVTIDTPIPSGTYTKLVHRTITAGAEALNSYTVTDVTGQVITISGTFSQNPAKDEQIILGPATLPYNLVRITRISPADDCIADIEAVDYSASVYTADASPTFGTVQAVATASSTKAIVENPYKVADNLINYAQSGPGSATSAVPQIHSGKFSDAGSGKVAWTAFTVTYLGTDYSVAANATGTTDDYIYWDSASTAAFSSTASISDVEGTATRWLVCYNDSGTPYCSGGPVGSYADKVVESATRKWAGETGADVTADNTAAGITGQGDLATLDTVGSTQIDDYSTHAGGTVLSETELDLTTSYQDVPDCSITFTSDGTVVECSCWGSLHNTGVAGHDITMRIYNVTESDAVLEDAKSVGASSTRRANYSVVSDKPTAGSVTYKLQAKADVAFDTCHVHEGAGLCVKQWKEK